VIRICFNALTEPNAFGRIDFGWGHDIIHGVAAAIEIDAGAVLEMEN